jgi:AcrR family transcriptional regulator
MADVNAPGRRYLSPRRQQTAQQTRRAVLAAAQALFVERGYPATTIEQIAQRAGVSKPTVFAAVGSKATVLKQLRDLALAGDEQPVPVAQRAWYQRALREPDPYRSLRLHARNVTDIHQRSADLHEVLRSAATADPELAELWHASERERRTGAGYVVDALLRKGPLKAGLDRDSAIDLVWVLTSTVSFQSLVRTRGWPRHKYEQWLGDSFCQQLLPTPPAHR